MESRYISWIFDESNCTRNENALDAKLFDYELTATQYIVLIECMKKMEFHSRNLATYIWTTASQELLTEWSAMVCFNVRDDIDRRVVNVYLTPKGKLLRLKLNILLKN